MQVARVGDRVFGIFFSTSGPVPCGGSIISGAPGRCAEGPQIAIIGSQVLIDCGDLAQVVTGSSKVCANGIAVALLGDRVIGPRFIGTISSISQSKVFAGR